MTFLMVTTMDKYYTDMELAFAEDEASYENSVLDAAKRIFENKNIKMVFVTGGSCAGKTPTTERLAHYLATHGRKTELISLDDFYRNPEDAIYNEDGSPDYESLESLDLELLHGCFEALCNGKSAWMPRFDFKKKRRSNVYHRMSLEEDEVCIVEGLHALNPEICGYIDKDKTFKVFLEAMTDLYSEPRLLRRIVRDYYKRGATAEDTMGMWANVEHGTRSYIYPYKDDVDAAINTYIAYERYVMRDDALQMLSEVPADSPYRKRADELVAMLEPLPSLPKERVSSTSFMREFLTKRT